MIGCADKSTSPEFKPSEGNIWPPSSVLKVFGIGGLDQPAGITNPAYWTATATLTTATEQRIHNYLDIGFDGGTEQSKYLINDHLIRNGFVLEEWSSNWYWEAYGWKTGNNRLYWAEVDIYFGNDGYIFVERVASNLLKLGWPTATDLTVFALGDWGMPSGISNQYYLIEQGLSASRLFSRFTGATELTRLLIDAYLESKAEKIYAWGSGAEFERVIGNTVYYYEYDVDIASGFGYIELFKYENDRPDEYFRTFSDGQFRKKDCIYWNNFMDEFHFSKEEAIEENRNQIHSKYGRKKSPFYAKPID